MAGRRICELTACVSFDADLFQTNYEFGISGEKRLRSSLRFETGWLAISTGFNQVYQARINIF